MAGRVNWRQAFAEVGLLLAGAGLAVLADSLVDERKERQEEGQYLQALAADMAANEESLEALIERYLEIHAADSTLLAVISGASAPIPDDSLRNVVTTGFMYQLFRPAMGTYDDMVGAGDLRILQSDRLRVGLADFREQVNDLQVLIDVLDTRWASIEEPFIIRELQAGVLYDGYRGVLQIPDYAIGELELPRTEEFANLLVLRMVVIQDIVVEAREISGSLRELRGLL